jgi:hypothetical protein
MDVRDVVLGVMLVWFCGRVMLFQRLQAYFSNIFV